jgi:hypothetical protein
LSQKEILVPKSKKDPYSSDPKIIAIKAHQTSDDRKSVRLIWEDKKRKEVPMQIDVIALEGVLQGLSILVHQLKQGSRREISFAPNEVTGGGAAVDESNNVILYFYDPKDVRINYRLHLDQAEEVYDKFGKVLKMAKNKDRPKTH